MMAILIILFIQQGRQHDRSTSTLWSHVNGTHNIMECTKKCKTRRVFYISAVEIYGEWKSDEKLEKMIWGLCST